MTSGRSRCGAALVLVLMALAAACDSSEPAPAFQVTAGDNVLPISVNGSGCGQNTYVNQPCVSVRVCEPGTNSCQTIDGVLLDTGSFGLRVFKQVLTVSLPTKPAPGGGTLAECARFADLSADWGPVVMADVILANEPRVRVPIHVIDATFGTVPSSCPNPETGPTFFNGILGVGVFVEDCGFPVCPSQANLYFSSDGPTTTPVSIPAADQVQNPVGLLPIDNNGVIVALPRVPEAGARSVDGALVIGIGTRANNAPVSASALALDGSGNFTTTLGGQVIPDSFVDTGSNGLFFAPPAPIPACAAASDWFCPPAPISFSATNGPSPGFPGNRLGASFQIGNFEALVVQPTNGNAVFANVGGAGIAGFGFDWGLPFFLGRTVYLGIAGRRSVFGDGPVLAY